jgi:hypothetical protein
MSLKPWGIPAGGYGGAGVLFNKESSPPVGGAGGCSLLYALGLSREGEVR